MIKALVLSQYWYPENGVAQRRWQWLTGIATANGVSVQVMAPPPHYRRTIDFSDWLASAFSLSRGQSVEHGPVGETIVRTPFLPSSNSLTGKALNQLAVAGGMLLTLGFRRQKRPVKPDVVIGTVPAIPTAFITFIVAKGFGVPYIIDLRDAWPELLGESARWNEYSGEKRSFREVILRKGPLQLATKVLLWAFPRILARAEHVLVTAESMEQSIPAYLSTKGLDSPPVSTVRNVFPPITVPKIKRKRGLNSPFRVLYAGTMGRAQDLNNALAAAKLLAKDGVEVEMRFVGAGAAKHKLREQAKRLGISTEFLPEVQSSQLEEHYAWADTCLVHLADWESLKKAVPSKLYELVSNRIHITAVVQGEAGDLVSALHAGVVVPPGNPFALAEVWYTLINNPEMLDIGGTGAEWVLDQRQNVAPKVFLKALGVEIA